jgi:adenosine deaminase
MQPLRTLPKAVLHDHIDGGLRVETVVELAADAGYDGLPTTDPSELAAWFFQGGSGSLEAYLEAFRHTVAVLQTPEGLERATFEAVEDLAADGVVYAELRFGPSLHMQRGMHREDAIAAVLAGVKRGREQTGMSAWVIVTALRQEDDSYEVARAAARFLGEGVVGFDLAGPEAGHPADAHLAACRHARESGLALTVHGGEGDGPESIWRAVTRCGAQRVGHGVRIIEDTVVADGTIVKLGALARSIRDQRIPLEVAVTSNLHTGIAPRRQVASLRLAAGCRLCGDRQHRQSPHEPYHADRRADPRSRHLLAVDGGSR